MKSAAFALLIPASLFAAALPGFRVEMIGSGAGFISSIAIDSRGTVYYTTTKGDLFHFVSGQSTLIAHVQTDAIGNSGLLGMALADDNTAVVHYTTPMQTHDIVSTIDVTTGSEALLVRFVDDITFPGRATPPEHHGGNPTIAPDGSIFVGIGDFGGGIIAQKPEWNAGKIFRIWTDGRVEQFALGFRNPFDMSWDAANRRLIVPDNGEEADDEINIVTEGGNYGWPYTMGNRPAFDGDVAPLYVFPTVVAPTGMAAVRGRNPYLRSGYLLGSFVTRAIYYIPDIDAHPFPDPLPLVERETGSVIDVAEAPNGDVYFTTGNAIYRLVFPAAGDCNGDGRVDIADIGALERELADGNPQRTIDAQGGVHRGSWGCDANLDGVIDGKDRAAMVALLKIRIRAAR